jgi:hypothetical protein
MEVRSIIVLIKVADMLLAKKRSDGSLVERLHWLHHAGELSPGLSRRIFVSLVPYALLVCFLSVVRPPYIAGIPKTTFGDHEGASLSQEPTPKDVHFHLIGQGKLAKKGADSVDFSNYKADDGTKLQVRIEGYHSASGAQDAMEKLTKQASRFIDNTPRLDEHGNKVGERSVFLVPTGHWRRSLAVAAWMQGTDLYIIESPKLDYVLAYENQHFPSASKPH